VLTGRKGQRDVAEQRSADPSELPGSGELALEGGHGDGLNARDETRQLGHLVGQDPLDPSERGARLVLAVEARDPPVAAAAQQVPTPVEAREPFAAACVPPALAFQVLEQVAHFAHLPSRALQPSAHLGERGSAGQRFGCERLGAGEEAVDGAAHPLGSDPLVSCLAAYEANEFPAG